MRVARVLVAAPIALAAAYLTGYGFGWLLWLRDTRRAP